jgi:hypothetical protein
LLKKRKSVTRCLVLETHVTLNGGSDAKREAVFSTAEPAVRITDGNVDEVVGSAWITSQGGEVSLNKVSGMTNRAPSVRSSTKR